MSADATLRLPGSPAGWWPPLAGATAVAEKRRLEGQDLALTGLTPKDPGQDQDLDLKDPGQDQDLKTVFKDP